MKTLSTSFPDCIASIIARIPKIKCSFSIWQMYKKKPSAEADGFRIIFFKSYNSAGFFLTVTVYGLLSDEPSEKVVTIAILIGVVPLATVG